MRDDNKLVFSTKKVSEIQAKAEEGYKIPRDEKFWFMDNPMVRRSGLTWSYSDDELVEYFKCKLGVATDGTPYRDPETQELEQMGVLYFSEKYCKIKNENGQINKIRLRDYQKEILVDFNTNRFNILMASRQCGKCLTASGLVELSKVKLQLNDVWYSSLETKTIYDKLKYFFYKIIEKIS